MAHLAPRLTLTGRRWNTDGQFWLKCYLNFRVTVLQPTLNGTLKHRCCQHNQSCRGYGYSLHADYTKRRRTQIILHTVLQFHVVRAYFQTGEASTKFRWETGIRKRRKN